MTDELRVGQLVRAFSKRWTPDGWEPVEELATVVDPCVQNDPDYAGDVELKIDGVLNRVFAPRASIEPIVAGAAIRAVLEEAAIAAEALEQSERELVPDSLWASVKADAPKFIRSLKES